MKRPFPGVASNIPDTMSIFPIWLYALLKWSIVIYSRPVPYLVMCERVGWSWILISLGEWGQSHHPSTSPQSYQTWGVCPMLCQRRRHWANVSLTLGQQTRIIDPMMFWYILAAAEDAAPTFKRHWVNLLSARFLVKELTRGVVFLPHGPRQKWIHTQQLWCVDPMPIQCYANVTDNWPTWNHVVILLEM